MSVLTAKDLERKFRRRKRLRALSKLPIIGDIIMEINPEHMFDEPEIKENEN